MEREREGNGRNDLFGRGDLDPFGMFRGFGMMPKLFGGRDPFDDPFFTRPFPSMFESNTMFQTQSPSDGAVDALRSDRGKGIQIEELGSDDDGEREAELPGEEGKNRQRHAGPGREPSVEHPDDESVERKTEIVKHGTGYNVAEQTEPQARSFGYQTRKVTYGGVDGAYYTSTRTRRTGNDGVVIEESKEADKTTGQATHRISRGIHDKGHSVTRKLNSDGKVDTMQTLHNLHEEELPSFEQAWRGNVNEQLRHWNDHFDMHGTAGSKISEQKWTTNPGGWLLPSFAGARGSDLDSRANTSGTRTKKVARINIE